MNAGEAVLAWVSENCWEMKSSQEPDHEGPRGPKVQKGRSSEVQKGSLEGFRICTRVSKPSLMLRGRT